MAAKVTVALDWTPNTNHLGFYVAKARGWYADAGLDVTLLSPHHDGYKRTPASRVADGSATFAVTPSETVLSSHTLPASQVGTKPVLVAVAALQCRSTDAVVTLKASGIDTPAKLTGTYASYGARYEGRIVQELIKADSGTGVYTETVPPMLGIWNTLLAGKADATWVFMGWEGVEAAMKGVELNVFKLADYGIAYGYSPLLVADPARLDGATTKAFLAATARGFQLAASEPDVAAKLFFDLAIAENPDLPTPLDADMCARSARYLAAEKAFIGDSGKWGVMTRERWAAFVDWLSSAGLLTQAAPSRQPDGVNTVSLDDLRSGKGGQAVAPPQPEALFTNEYLQQEAAEVGG